jgi:hypothetical protein
MTETEIEDMKKELILLRMQKKRLEDDLKKMQLVVKDILIRQIAENLVVEPDQVEATDGESADTTPNEHCENPA